MLHHLYETAAKDSSAFSDVTIGYNVGCPNSTSFNRSFPAAPGWDAASGYGSPDYEKLKTYVLDAGQKTKKYV